MSEEPQALSVPIAGAGFEAVVSSVFGVDLQATATVRTAIRLKTLIFMGESFQIDFQFNVRP